MISLGRLHVLTLSATAILAALGIVGGSQLTAIAGVLLIVAVLAGAPGLHVLARSSLRTWVVHGATVLVLAYAIATFKTSRIDAVLLIVLLGVFNRFLLRGGHRDDFLIAGAATVLFAAATTITPGVAFLFLILAFVPSLLLALWTAMILGAAEASAPGGSVQAKMGAVGTVAARPAPRQLGVISLGGLGLMAVGFAAVSILPRYYFASFLGVGAFMSLPGASSSMELRTTGATDLGDATVVMRVEPLRPGGRAALAGLYARLHVLDEFDGQTFRGKQDDALFPLRLPADRLPEDRSESEPEPEDDETTVRVTLNRLERETAKHPLATLGRLGPTEVVRRHARQTVSGTWTTGSFRGAALSYKVHLSRRFNSPSLPRHLADRHQTVLTQLPEGLDPRVTELARRLTEGLATTQEKVDAVLLHFGRGFSYSLDPLDGTSSDPLVRFLFEARRGHCELYAGAAAVLLRAAGVKARVVTGFYNGTWNDLGGYLAFTNQDAHAWVEVFFEGEGWRWVDATPEDLRAVRRRPALAFLGDWYDAAEAFWFDNIIDFDEAKRKQLLERLSKRFEVLASDVGRVFEGEGAAGAGGRGAGSGALGILLAVGLASVPPAAVFGLIRRRRARRPESMGLRLRRALGEERGGAATLGALLARVPEGERAAAAEAIARYEELRFGPAEGAPRVEVVLSAIAAVERARRGRGAPRQPR